MMIGRPGIKKKRSLLELANLWFEAGAGAVRESNPVPLSYQPSSYLLHYTYTTITQEGVKTTTMYVWVPKNES